MTQDENQHGGEQESTQSAVALHSEGGGTTARRPCGCGWRHDDDGLLRKEAQIQFRLSGPIILAGLSQAAFQLISTMFVGHLGKLSLSSTAIAISVSNVTGFCSMMGMASCLETLCGQAFGAKQYPMLGIYLQRGLLVLNMTAIPFVFVYAYVGQILASLGQDKTISAEAGKYARWLIPTLFAQASIQPLIRFFQTQSLVHPMMLSSVFAVACHVPLCWFLTYRTSFGFQGAALSTSICHWVIALLLYAYLFLSPSCERTRAPLSWKAFHDMRSFFHLAIPSTAMICLSWWCYEILVVIAGLLPNPELQASTFATCLNLSNLTYQIAFGLAASASTRVSNELGGGRGEGAKRAIRVGMCLTMSQAAMVSIMFVFGRNVLGRVFSSDEEVVKNVAKMMKLLALSTFLDSTQAVLSGVARGSGWQMFGAFTNLVSFYIVGLPISCTLAFLTPLRAEGLWIGLICAPFFQLILLAYITWRADWDQEVVRAQKRIQSRSVVATPNVAIEKHKNHYDDSSFL